MDAGSRARNFNFTQKQTNETNEKRTWLCCAAATGSRRRRRGRRHPATAHPVAACIRTVTQLPVHSKSDERQSRRLLPARNATTRSPVFTLTNSIPLCLSASCCPDLYLLSLTARWRRKQSMPKHAAVLFRSVWFLSSTFYRFTFCIVHESN